MAEQDRSQEFAGRRVVVMGLGRFGGGVGVTRFLADRGADVLLTDLEPADKLEQSVAKLGDLVDAGAVELRLGEHNVSDFTTCDLVVVNPAVKPGNRFVRAAQAAGVEVTTEMRLLVQRLPNRGRTIGVTGSAGKSTVTAMIGHVLGKVFGISDGGFRMADGQGASATSDDNPKSEIRNPKSPRVWVGGNIGGSLLPHVEEIGADDWVVLELSSFMLDRLRADTYFPGWSPHIAVITNISPNHLDWHGSMAEYVRAKLGLFEYQSNPGVAFFGESVDPYVGYVEPNENISPPEHWFDEGFSACMLSNPPYEGHYSKMCALPGVHNRLNATFAEAVCQQVLIDIDTMSDEQIDQLVAQIDDALMSFPGLPHRLQLVAEHNGVRYFNDSKCTTPEAARLAIQAFIEENEGEEKGEEKGDKYISTGDQKRTYPLFIHLILGGKDKGSDLKPLAGLAASMCKAVYTIGALGETIAALCEGVQPAEAGRPESCGGVSWPAETAEVVRCGDLETAVAEIHKRVAPGDVVLLSPACASWDQFENYEQRGQRFIELVKRHINAP